MAVRLEMSKQISCILYVGVCKFSASLSAHIASAGVKGTVG